MNFTSYMYLIINYGAGSCPSSGLYARDNRGGTSEFMGTSAIFALKSELSIIDGRSKVKFA